MGQREESADVFDLWEPVRDSTLTRDSDPRRPTASRRGALSAPDEPRGDSAESRETRKLLLLKLEKKVNVCAHR